VNADGVSPLKQAASAGYVDVVSVILEFGGQVTPRVAKAAAGNHTKGNEVMALLLDQQGDQITITEEIVKAVAKSCDGGKEVMTLLLDWLGEQITITEEVVKAAAQNQGDSKGIIALLLDRRGDEITITEKVVKAAAWNYKTWNYKNGKEVMAVLLDHSLMSGYRHRKASCGHFAFDKRDAEAK
jgi:hypothetical protein